MGQNVFLGLVFRIVFGDDWGIGFVHCVDWVENVVVKHEVFKVEERGDFLLLVDLFNNFLVLGQHVVLDDLLTQQVHDFIVIDGVSWAVDGWILVEAESSFEAELDSVE